MLRERSQTFKLSFIGVDFTISVLAWISAAVLHFEIISPEKKTMIIPDAFRFFSLVEIFGEKYAPAAGYALLGSMFVFTQIVVFIASDMYHPRRGLNFLREMIGITRGVMLNVLLVLALLFFYRGASFSRLVILYFVIFSLAYHGAGHYFFRKFLEALRARGYNIRRVLVLGTNAPARQLVSSLLRHSIYGYRVVGMAGPRRGLAREYLSLIQGGIRDYKRLSRELNADMIVYSIPEDKKMVQDVLDYCDAEGLDCRIVPDWADFITRQARVEAIDGLPIFTIRDIPLKNGYNRLIKRAFDIVFSLGVLVPALPLMLLLAALVKLTSPGPIFFAQERVGLNRRTFRMYKFRSMRTQSRGESDTTWGSKNDARVTALGKFMRKTSLDELPQFWNVLIGDMSIVGPRPERPHFVKEFKARYSHYMRRHAVKSGITGWAQIQGLRGDTSIAERAEADIYYIENWSFWLDLLIVLRTPTSMLFNPGE